ncbi:MAG: YebC/PmpR family DNA-binding transcriptional regulator [Acidobacteriota bacterium]
MAGHSKWSTIKRKKAAVDAKRGKVFTKILREVTIAARIGGGDPDGNPRLRSAIQEARTNNVPSDNIERAVKKGTGELEGAVYEEVTYEGYGPSGVAMLVEVATDNRNRTVGEVRHQFSKHGGNLGENGCVSYLFDQRGYFAIDPGTLDEEAFMELALDLGADDIATDKGPYEIFAAVGDYSAIRDQLEAKGIAPDVAQLAMIPQTTVELDADSLSKVMRLVEGLEDLDDVQNVWANFEADDALLDAYEAG